MKVSDEMCRWKQGKGNVKASKVARAPDTKQNGHSASARSLINSQGPWETSDSRKMDRMCCQREKVES